MVVSAYGRRECLLEDGVKVSGRAGGGEQHSGLDGCDGAANGTLSQATISHGLTGAHHCFSRISPLRLRLPDSPHDVDVDVAPPPDACNA